MEGALIASTVFFRMIRGVTRSLINQYNTSCNKPDRVQWNFTVITPLSTLQIDREPHVVFSLLLVNEANGVQLLCVFCNFRLTYTARKRQSLEKLETTVRIVDSRLRNYFLSY